MKYLYTFLLAIVLTIYYAAECRGQTNNLLTLEEAVKYAKNNSNDANTARTRLQSSNWNYRNFKAYFLPKLSLNGVLPNYYRSINQITLPNGQNNFVSQDVAYSYSSLNLSQNIAMTGGTITASSSVQRLDNLGVGSNRTYTTVPLSITYNQDNLFFNSFRWQKQINELKRTEEYKYYIETCENIAYMTVQKYFDVLNSTVQYQLDQQNYAIMDTLHKTNKERFSLGTIGLNEVLQSEISLLNARKALINSKLLKDIELEKLMIYLNINDKFELKLPEKVKIFTIDESQALSHSHKTKYSFESKRRLLQAEQAIANAKAQSQPSISLRANIGATQSNTNFLRSYDNLIRTQSFAVGFNVPILDWGAAKSAIQEARANLKLEESTIASEQSYNDQMLLNEIKDWSNIMTMIEIANKVNALANKRFQIAIQKYKLGTQSFIEYNSAMLEKDQAVLSRIESLKNYWLKYYNLRRLTLFDYELQQPIQYDIFSVD